MWNYPFTLHVRLNADCKIGCQHYSFCFLFKVKFLTSKSSLRYHFSYVLSLLTFYYCLFVTFVVVFVVALTYCCCCCVTCVSGMAIGRGRAEGWGLRPCCAWFWLVPSLPRPAWREKISNPILTPWGPAKPCLIP